MKIPSGGLQHQSFAPPKIQILLSRCTVKIPSGGLQLVPRRRPSSSPPSLAALHRENPLRGTATGNNADYRITYTLTN